ncbi:MAG: hypothetical protein P8P30_10780 [Rickettsiales bacterium]|nr:hypothetical protein [Rickettsiales bacterium]
MEEKKPKILWIEDDKNMRINMGFAFERNFDIEFAENYDEAIQKGNGKYDLIVSDYNLQEGTERTGVNAQFSLRRGG